MKRWRLRIQAMNGEVLHEERFYLRRNAQRTADELVRPLPPVQLKDGRIVGPLMAYEIAKL